MFLVRILTLVLAGFATQHAWAHAGDPAGIVAMYTAISCTVAFVLHCAPTRDDLAYT